MSFFQKYKLVVCNVPVRDWILHWSLKYHVALVGPDLQEPSLAFTLLKNVWIHDLDQYRTKFGPMNIIATRNDFVQVVQRHFILYILHEIISLFVLVDFYIVF